MIKPLKSQHEKGIGQLMGNQPEGRAARPVAASAEAPTPSRASALAARPHPPGGAQRAQGLPPAQRPAPLSGPREVRK